MSVIKSPDEIERMRESCRIVAETLKKIRGLIKPGIATKDIDSFAEEYIISSGAEPAFKGYGQKGKRKGFPASVCVSVNEEIVHGIPGDRILEDGDIVSVDIGVKKNGFYGDAAYTYKVGNVSEKRNKLLKVTEESLYKGIEKALEGNTINDIAVAVQTYVEGSGFSVVRDLVGHGIGKNLHEEPAVPNFYNTANTYRLRKGMTIAIEPMVNYGEFAVETLFDGWTIVTKDGEPSAHFEHTILITDNKPEILTQVK